MGNQIADNSDNSLMQDIEDGYEQIGKDSRGVILLQKQTQATHLLKQYTFGCEAHYKSKLNQLKEQINSGLGQNIVSPVRVESKVFNSFCSTSYKIYAIFQYPQVTLKDQIIARQRESKNFDEAELWSILQSCTNALIQLKSTISLNPMEIFINSDGHLKIIHNDLVQQNYRVLLTPNIFYAPQKLVNFNKLDNQLGLKKQAIFSMGMTLLQASQLSEVTLCYDYKQGFFNQIVLKEMLEQLSQKYSPDFVQILENILDANPNRRASLMEVQNLLETYWKAEEYAQSSPASSKLDQIQSNIQEQPLVMKSQYEKPTHQQPVQPQECMTLTQKCFNREIKKTSGSKNNQQNKQISILNQIQAFKLKQPTQTDELLNINTPKNISFPKENFYTDPKLLEMIRKDLNDINRLKQSNFFEPSKYSFMYPETQSILNSIKNIDYNTESKYINYTNPIQYSTEVNNVQYKQPQFQQLKSYNQQFQKIDNALDNKNQVQGNEVAAAKFMMKKNKTQTDAPVFMIETYEDGRKYEGLTLNRKKHGQGKLIYDDGAYYEGQFCQDKMNGKGILYYSVDQPAYDGEWLNDQFNGNGVLYNQSPVYFQGMFDFRNLNQVEDYWIKYQGEFNLDNKAGIGKLYLTNGEHLQGQFSDDLVNGRANFYRNDGEVIQGIWEDNILVSIVQDEDDEQY